VGIIWDWSSPSPASHSPLVPIHFQAQKQRNPACVPSSRRIQTARRSASRTATARTPESAARLAAAPCARCPMVTPRRPGGNRAGREGWRGGSVRAQGRRAPLESGTSGRSRRMKLDPPVSSLAWARGRQRRHSGEAEGGGPPPLAGLDSVVHDGLPGTHSRTLFRAAWGSRAQLPSRAS
jgi:hypothetical protein